MKLVEELFRMKERRN